MATTVRITETYDLKTTTNKLGIIGIHTPSSRQIRQMYPGLVKNHKFIRILRCDVMGACASVLPADPLSVGVQNGDVAPEDMFNPILYKPVSNESFETLISRIYGSSDIATLGSVTKEERLTNAFDIYYSLLAESKKWKKAMPQRGFGLRGLYPICYQMINTFGQQIPANTKKMVLSEDGTYPVEVEDETSVPVANSALTDGVNSSQAITFRGKSVRMPRIPMHYGPEDVGAVYAFYIPKTFVACLLVPPSRLHEFYYRMRVTWTIRFEGVASAQEYGNSSSMTMLTSVSYAKDYTYSSSKAEMDNEEDSVDTDNVDIHKIMES